MASSLFRSVRATALVNAGWMGFVWVQRIRNAVVNQEVNPTAAYVMSGAMLAGAVTLAVAGGARPETPLGRTVTRVAPAAHAGLWVVRGVQIATSDRSVPFIVVHEVLALISIGLAAWAWSVTRRDALPTPAGV
jgi:hypothetical protein